LKPLAKQRGDDRGKNGAANIPEKCHGKEFVASVFSRTFGFAAGSKTFATQLTYNTNWFRCYLSQTKNSRICSRFRSCSLVSLLGDATLNNMFSKRFVESPYRLGCGTLVWTSFHVSFGDDIYFFWQEINIIHTI